MMNNDGDSNSSTDNETETKPCCLVTNPEVPEIAINLLKTEFKIVVCESRPTEREEILRKSQNVDAILWADNSILDVEVLEASGEKLKVVSIMSSDVDNVDLNELKTRGIACGYTPDLLSDAVADLAIGLMIAAARRFHEASIQISQSGGWENWRLQWLLGQEIRGTTVGFIGFGRIGQKIYKRLQGFENQAVIYTCRNKIAAQHLLHAKHVQFGDVLVQSDIIFVVCSKSEETTNMIDECALNKMKKNCILVNVSRAEIIDQDALFDALKNNTIFAAGLDITTPEPLPTDHPLLTLPNCVISPHLGTATFKTREDIALLAVHNIIRGFHKEELCASAY